MAALTTAEMHIGWMPSVKIESTREISVDEGRPMDSTILSWEAERIENSLEMACFFCNGLDYTLQL